MTTAKKTKIFEILQKVLFDYCVDKTNISSVKQITKVNGESFSQNINNNDCIRIKYINSKEQTISSIKTKNTTDTTITTIKQFVFEVKYVGENAEIKLEHVINILKNSIQAKQLIKSYGIYIENINDIQNISVVFNDVFYDQAVTEITLTTTIEDVLTENID